MASPNIPHNAYTDAPLQHPNLILGSLQLLFWLFFRPAAWSNHLKRIDPYLNSNISLIFFILIFFPQRRWQNLRLWQLFIQAYVILPILNDLIVGLILWVLGEPIATIVNYVARRVPGSIVVSLFLALLFGVPGGVAFSMVFSIVFGVVFSLTGGVAFSLIGGAPREVAVGVLLGVAFGVPGGVAAGMTQSEALRVKFGVAAGLVTGLAFGIAASLATGLAFGVGLTINSWRPVLSFPFLSAWNYLLYRLDKRRNAKSFCLFRYHSAFWDEWQRLPLLGLDEYLLFVIEHSPVEGKAAQEYLSTSPQRWAIQSAQIELDVRSLESCADVEAIRRVHRRLEISELETLINNRLRITNTISDNVDAALNQESFYNQRLALRAIIDRINVHLEELIRSNDKFAPRFYSIAKKWREIIANYAEELAKATELRQEIDSPYIIGVPLTQEQQIFTGRNDIGTRIEQLLIDRRRPPLLLYGQRRMGKTSLLNNLGKLLPNTIIPMFVDLQGAPVSASNHAGFLYNLAREMVKSSKQQGVTLPTLTREALTSDPFTTFDEWLDTVEQTLEQNTALLMLDEFEVLDSAITKGRFDEQDILGMLRHLIQHRPRFKVLLAGSHTIEEYQRWASYLINVQVVHISYLKEAEARQLIERPVKDFTLRYEPDAVERVLQLTRCHPFLIQLLCAEIIALKNEQDPSVRRLATLADVEAAIPEAFKSGSLFFADIENNQVDDNGRAILRFIAAQGEGAIALHETLSQQFPQAATTRKLLLQRELIEEVGEGDRFGVELIRRWFTLDR